MLGSLVFPLATPSEGTPHHAHVTTLRIEAVGLISTGRLTFFPGDRNGDHP